MTWTVFFAVLFAALLHATWNSLVKGSQDKYVGMLLIALGHVPPGVIFVFFAPLPGMDVLPWLGASLALHLGYQLFLAASYRVGDLTTVYPIARGSAPLFVTMVSLTVLDVDLSWWQVGSVGLLILGLLLLSYDRLGTNKRQWTVVILALVTGGFIASYSIVDGLGARKMGYALAYWGWVAIGNGALMTLWMLLFQPFVNGEGSFILAKPYNSFTGRGRVIFGLWHCYLGLYPSANRGDHSIAGNICYLRFAHWPDFSTRKVNTNENSRLLHDGCRRDLLANHKRLTSSICFLIAQIMPFAAPETIKFCSYQ